MSGVGKELFLSYGREPEVVSFVTQLKHDLERSGFTVWLDTEVYFQHTLHNLVIVGWYLCSGMQQITDSFQASPPPPPPTSIVTKGGDGRGGGGEPSLVPSPQRLRIAYSIPYFVAGYCKRSFALIICGLGTRLGRAWVNYYIMYI